MDRSFRSPSASINIDPDYADNRKRGTSSSQRLLVAIMRRAIWDFVLYKDEDASKIKPEKGRTRKARKELEEEKKRSEERFNVAVDAAGWLFWDGAEEVDSEGRYTFLHICELLDLRPKELRDRILVLTRNDVQSLNNHIKED